MPDVVLLGESYKGWQIKVTPIVPAYGYFYEITEPGQEPTGVITGIAHKTLDECVEKQSRQLTARLRRRGVPASERAVLSSERRASLGYYCLILLSCATVVGWLIARVDMALRNLARLRFSETMATEALKAPRYQINHP